MPDQGERLTIAQISRMYPEQTTPAFEWVRHSDYEKLQARTETKEIELSELSYALQEVKRQRDQACKQREELRERLGKAVEAVTRHRIEAVEKQSDVDRAGPLLCNRLRAEVEEWMPIVLDSIFEETD